MVTPTAYKYFPQEKIRHIQSISVSFLHYARALDYAMLTALNDIGTTQAKPTEHSLE